MEHEGVILNLLNYGAEMNIQDEVRSNEQMYHKYQGVCRTAGTYLKWCINSQESFVAFENKTAWMVQY